MYERLPETIRVRLASVSLPDYYVLVVPNKAISPQFRDFFLVNDETGFTDFMFGCEVETDEEATLLAKTNALDYI